MAGATRQPRVVSSARGPPWVFGAMRVPGGRAALRAGCEDRRVSAAQTQGIFFSRRSQLVLGTRRTLPSPSMDGRPCPGLVLASLNFDRGPGDELVYGSVRALLFYDRSHQVHKLTHCACFSSTADTPGALITNMLRCFQRAWIKWVWRRCSLPSMPAFT